MFPNLNITCYIKYILPIEQSIPIVLEAAILTLTMGSFANTASLGRKNEAKSGGLIPALKSDPQICVNLNRTKKISFGFFA
jgi:hypothetical protein